MVVVADTAPLRYLVLIERDHILPALYGRVLSLPLWPTNLTMRAPRRQSEGGWPENHTGSKIRQPAHALGPEVDLDLGERETIALAEETAAGLVLVDEWDARHEAERRNLRVAGTTRVLADAAIRGLIDLEDAFERLRLRH